MIEENEKPQGEEPLVNQTQPPPIPQEPIYQGQPQGGAYGQVYSESKISQENLPNNYMVMSIVATIVGFLGCCGNCCIAGILGIVAIVYSNQVHPKFMMGDNQGATNAASTAKILGIISLVLTALTFLGGIISFITGLLDAGGIEGMIEQQRQMLDQLN